MKNVSISRRRFIRRTSLAAAALTSAGLITTACRTGSKPETAIPVRTLGRTNESITILGYGGGSQFMRMPDGEWEPHLEHALNAGINYFDTASSYGANTDKPSEARFGEILPPHRKKILLLTKIHERDPDKARREFERSLERLKTDYVDILLIHAIKDEDTLTGIETGTYALLQQLRKEKMVRYTGFSSMDSAGRSRDLIDNLDFDITLLAINPTRYGNFVETALPAARKKNMGVIAMKVMRDIVNDYAGPRELIEYAWNREGVNCALVSHTGMAPLEENISLAVQYGNNPAAAANRFDLEERLAHLAGPKHLVYARPGYADGVYV